MQSRVLNAAISQFYILLMQTGYVIMLKQWLHDEVYESPKDDIWGFGQLCAILGLVSMIIQIWEYAKSESAVNQSVPRYKHWYLLCMIQITRMLTFQCYQ